MPRPSDGGLRDAAALLMVRACRYVSDRQKRRDAEHRSARFFRTVELGVLVIQGAVGLVALGVAFLAYQATSLQAEYGLRAAKAQALTAGLQTFAEAQKKTPRAGRCVRLLVNLKSDRPLENGLNPTYQDVKVLEWTNLTLRDAWACFGPRILSDQVTAAISLCPTTPDSDPRREDCFQHLMGMSDEQLRGVFTETLPYAWYREAFINAAEQLNAVGYLYATLATSEPDGNWGQACEMLFYTREIDALSEKAGGLPGRWKPRKLRLPEGCRREFLDRNPPPA